MGDQIKLWVNKRTLGALAVVLLVAVGILVIQAFSGGGSGTAGTGAGGSTTLAGASTIKAAGGTSTTSGTGSTTTTIVRSTTAAGGATTTGPRATTATTVITAPPGVGTIARSSLPKQAITTLGLIDKGGPYPYRQDGVIWENREGLLPDRDRGYYHEYTVVTPGSPDRGARRIITGDAGERYYTDDHYASFRLIVPG